MNTNEEAEDIVKMREEIVKQCLAGKPLFEKDGALAPMIQSILNAVLEGEMDAHLTDLQNRGVRDILIACEDGLKGFPDAINSVFPDTAVQLCIVHQIRNSIKYVGSKHQKEFMRDLKTVYQAVSKESAEDALDRLDAKWGEPYPIVIKSWRDNWGHLTEYFQYTAPIRKLIYTTNTVEGYHRQVRKVTKNKGVFTNDSALENWFTSHTVTSRRSGLPHFPTGA